MPIKPGLRRPWSFEKALCREVGGELFFTVDRDDSSFPIWDTSEIRQAKKICAKCIHTSECAEWGVHHEKHGVWGGLDSTDLRAARMNRNILLQELELSDLKNH